MRLDSFELSKIAGGFLCALLVIVGFRVALEIAEHGKAPEKPGYVLPAPEAAPAHGDAPAGGAAAPAAAAFDPAAVAQAAASGNAQAGGGNLQEMHGLSFRRARQAPTRSAPTSPASSAAPRRATPVLVTRKP